MVILDTNAILRYILQDNQDMADIVEKELSKSSCFVPVEIIAEIVYVLSKVYEVERKIISQTLADMADTGSFIFDKKDVVLHAFQVYAVGNLDFVDCLLVGYATVEKCAIFTFDKQLQKQLNRS